MRPIAISNIAWPANADAQALALAVELELQGIELAPAKAFGSWETITLARAAEYRRRIADLGLTVPAFQAIAYGVSGVRLFGSTNERERLAKHLTFVAKLAGAMGARACVFGSPGLRDPGEFTPEAAFDQAVAFFRALGPTFTSEGTVLGIEPNPAVYGCRFMTHTKETLALAAAVDHPGVRIHFDAGAALFNGDSDDIIARALVWTTHVHAAELHLVPLGTSAVDHGRIARIMDAVDYDGWVSIEMRAVEPWRKTMRRAAAFARQIYG